MIESNYYEILAREKNGETIEKIHLSTQDGIIDYLTGNFIIEPDNVQITQIIESIIIDSIILGKLIETKSNTKKGTILRYYLKKLPGGWKYYEKDPVKNGA